MASGSGPDEGAFPPPAAPGEATGRFGPQQPPNVNVQVNAQNLHINPSNLAALERIVTLNPQVASELVRVSGQTVRYERDRYNTGAICATVVCGLLLVCAAAVVVTSGFWAGIAFFLACVVVASVVAAIFTGKAQDLSWTVGMMPGSRSKAKRAKSDPDPDA